MPENTILEVAVIGESLKRLLEASTLRQRRTFKDVMCESLREAYENTSSTIYNVDIEFPGGPEKSPSQRGVEDPRLPGDEIEEEQQPNIVVRPQVNPRKMELLNEALRWGCAWAEKEFITIGGKLPLGQKARNKK